MMMPRTMREFFLFWRAWRRQRELLASLRREYDATAQLKGRILAIGEIWPAPDGNGVILSPEWQFDCSNGAMVHRVDDQGRHFFCGYSCHELIEIHQHRKEWEPLALER